MRAVAIAILGPGPDAEDALQDATLAAITRIGELREAGACGAWLRAIVRNCCLMLLRSRRDVPLPVDMPLASSELTPEEVIDRHVLRDWVWHATEELSPPLRTALTLRYFCNAPYEQIAAACEIPVGTVRSRLNQARAKLATALQATAEEPHADTVKLTAQSCAEASTVFEAAARGEFAAVVGDRWAPDVEITTDYGKRFGRDELVAAVNGNVAAGIRARLVNVVAGRDLMIWEIDFINPPDDPYHCPPGAAWVLSLERGWVRRIRLLHRSRPRSAAQ